ncbi:ribosomal protein S18-alanine N-acetyltransferase [Streptomyces sp. BE303]|uniref:ribosomal protein S18-alanine N-acetyltransferase n=1 Tax=Streptomyces sp. BE303 TaxID=3002528 RepID=UPI002E76F9D2|nr:ribosomal protein S18-alanine N-acetyltransferase [Streptomyces sp. BE303]MED7951808.1 ribosomal protein S18-alanine N-acetyltransferase [Streptomyces sp. BE303]
MRWWDIAPVMELELELFPEDAWSTGMYWSELAETHPGGTRHYTVAATPDGAVVGYAGLMAVAGEGDVQTIAVDGRRQGTGLGTALLTDLVREAVRRGCVELLLEVRVDNPRAQRLYERFGFEPVGIRRGYYQPANVDALVMRLDLADRDDPADLDDGDAPERDELPDGDAPDDPDGPEGPDGLDESADLPRPDVKKDTRHG